MTNPIETLAQFQEPVCNQNAMLDAWSLFFMKLDDLQQTRFDAMQVLTEIQLALNASLLDVDDDIACQLVGRDYRLSKDSKEIEIFKKKNPFQKNTLSYEALFDANADTGLLLGLENGLDIYFSQEQLKRNKRIEKIQTIFSKFEEEAEAADQFIFQNLESQWEQIKQKGLYSEQSAILCCALFSKLGLMQMECLTKTKRVLDSVDVLDESQIETCLEILNRVSIDVISSNVIVWQKFPKVSRDEVDGCIKKMTSVLNAIENFKVKPLIMENAHSFKTIKIENHLGIGFKNIGNSCYINATLQMLFTIPEICHLINTIPRENKIFLYNLYNLQRLIKLKEEPTEVALRNFREALFLSKGKGCLTGDMYEQHDAHEFLVFVLDQLGWNLLKTHTCTLLENDAISHFGDLQASNHLSVEMNGTSLMEILNSYSAFEEMNQNLSLNIDGKTKNFTKWKRAIQIKECPPYLFVHLKRFQAVDGIMKKNSEKVELPLTQDLMIAGKNYQLMGCINHHGKAINTGHYTADIKKENGEWVRYSDSKIQPISAENVGTEAYIVVLKRKD